MTQTEYTHLARKIIHDNIYMTIATATVQGEPWIFPVFFAYDDRYHLYWVSNKDSRHSSLIRSNPYVAIVIFDSRAPEGDGDGVYFEAVVHELEEEVDIEKAIKTLNNRVTKEEFRIKKIDEVTNEGVWRVYRAIPTKVYKLTEGEFVNGQYIDKKVEINLK
jgi:nitroimidazol reductase NimA-like FMN-containing flavoprotein (pyridoxamine 5'-phosphate oxidase superfamily)